MNMSGLQYTICRIWKIVSYHWYCNAQWTCQDYNIQYAEYGKLFPIIDIAMNMSGLQYTICRIWKIVSYHWYCNAQWTCQDYNIQYAEYGKLFPIIDIAMNMSGLQYTICRIWKIVSYHWYCNEHVRTTIYNMQNMENCFLSLILQWTCQDYNIQYAEYGKLFPIIDIAMNMSGLQYTICRIWKIVSYHWYCNEHVRTTIYNMQNMENCFLSLILQWTCQDYNIQYAEYGKLFPIIDIAMNMSGLQYTICRIWKIVSYHWYCNEHVRTTIYNMQNMENCFLSLILQWTCQDYNIQYAEYGKLFPIIDIAMNMSGLQYTICRIWKIVSYHWYCNEQWTCQDYNIQYAEYGKLFPIIDIAMNNEHVRTTIYNMQNIENCFLSLILQWTCQDYNIQYAEYWKLFPIIDIAMNMSGLQYTICRIWKIVSYHWDSHHYKYQTFLQSASIFLMVLCECSSLSCACVLEVWASLSSSLSLIRCSVWVNCSPFSPSIWPTEYYISLTEIWHRAVSVNAAQRTFTPARTT